VSGMSFDDYVDRHIFQPLGMLNSTFREPLPAGMAARMSAGYEFEDGQFEPKSFEFIHSIGPAGAMSATATDMARFMLAHLQGGPFEAARILEPATVQLMHKRTMSPDPALNGSLLGFYETWIDGRRIIGHGGDTVHFHSVLSLLPEAQLGLFASVNTGGPGADTAVALEQAFFAHYFPAKLPGIKPPADAQQRNERYAGTYRSLRHSSTAFEKALAMAGEIKAQPMPDGSLFMPDPTRAQPARWIEVSDGVFRKTDTDQFIAFKDEGGAMGLVGDFPAIAAERVPWYETGKFHELILAVCLLLFITALVAAIRKWRADRAERTSLRWARPLLALTCVLLIVFVILIAVVLASGIEALIYRIPPALYVALALPLLALPVALAATFFAIKLWSTRAWSFGARLHYSLATLATLAFLVILNYWNLLGFRFG